VQATYFYATIFVAECEVNMNPNVVFFGDANYGKSTVIGRIYAENHNIDMDKVKETLYRKLGKDLYADDWLYPSLVNPQTIESVRRGKKAASESHEVRNIEIEFSGIPTKTSFIDTPGQKEYDIDATVGMEMGNIGIFCLSIEKVLADNFNGDIFVRSDTFSEIHPNSKLIYLLTKFNLPLAGYKKSSYERACEKIIKHCRVVEVMKNEAPFGVEIEERYITHERNDVAIIPVAVEFDTKEKEGVNLFFRSAKTPWYSGLTLVEAVRNRVQEMAEAHV